MNILNRVTKSLDEAIQIEKGQLKGRRNILTINSVIDFNCEEIKLIRQSLEMTQRSFASLLGVSNKTVEAWETGTNRPNGSARRLLELLKLDKNIPKKYYIIE